MGIVVQFFLIFSENLLCEFAGSFALSYFEIALYKGVEGEIVAIRLYWHIFHSDIEHLFGLSVFAFGDELLGKASDIAAENDAVLARFGV